MKEDIQMNEFSEGLVIYKCPMFSQVVGDKAENLCWILAPTIASSSELHLSKNNDFKESKAFKAYEESLTSISFDKDQFENALIDGIDPGIIEKTLEEDMGLIEGGYLNSITESYSEYIEKDADDLRDIYNNINDILRENGPFVMLKASQGGGDTHQYAVTGVVLAKNSKTNEKEIFLIINDTMEARLKALSIRDCLEIQEKRENKDIKIFYPPHFNEAKQAKYSFEEVKQIFSDVNNEQYAKFRDDFCADINDKWCNFDCIVKPKPYDSEKEDEYVIINRENVSNDNLNINNNDTSDEKCITM